MQLPYCMICTLSLMSGFVVWLARANFHQKHLTSAVTLIIEHRQKCREVYYYCRLERKLFTVTGQKFINTMQCTQEIWRVYTSVST